MSCYFNRIRFSRSISILTALTFLLVSAGDVFAKTGNSSIGNYYRTTENLSAQTDIQNGTKAKSDVPIVLRLRNVKKSSAIVKGEDRQPDAAKKTLVNVTKTIGMAAKSVGQGTVAADEAAGRGTVTAGGAAGHGVKSAAKKVGSTAKQIWHGIL